MLLHQTSPSCGPSPSTWPEVSIKHRRFAAAHRGLTGHACAVNTKDRQATNIEQDSLQRALKEWAVTCAALGQGDQTVILRKGGIREPTFKPAAKAFLLFPTSFHTKADLLTAAANTKYQKELAFDQKKETLLILRHVARVTGCWTTHDPAVLSATSEHHVWTDQFLNSRLKWRSKQPITVMELRVCQLAKPLVIPSQDSYWGCFSWTEVAGGVSQEQVQASQDVLAESDFLMRQERLRKALGMLKDCSEVSV